LPTPLTSKRSERLPARMSRERVAIGVYELDRQQQHQRTRENLPQRRDRGPRRRGEEILFGLGLLEDFLVDLLDLRLLLDLVGLLLGNLDLARLVVFELSFGDLHRVDLDRAVLVDVVDLDPLLDGLLADLRLAARTVGHAVAPADLDVPAFEGDVFLGGGLVDFDPIRRGRRRARGACRTGRRRGRLVLVDQPLQCVELRLAAAATHLSVGHAEDLRRDAESGLAVRTLSEHQGRRTPYRSAQSSRTVAGRISNHAA
jgi:hypothetical protein